MVLRDLNFQKLKSLGEEFFSSNKRPCLYGGRGDRGGGDNGN